MKTMHVKPARGARVRTEDGKIIASAGQTVPASAYYRRRVKEGGLVIADTLVANQGAAKKGAAK